MIALEISVNGEILYAVGAENWGAMSASVDAQRFSLDGGIDGTPTAVVQGVVNVPSKLPGQFDGRIYKHQQLALGDVVEIRFVEKDAVDEPNRPQVLGAIGVVQSDDDDSN